MSKKTIVISGGAGFLGSHLAKRYLDKDYEVIAVDNLCTGSKQNIAEFLTNSKFTFIQADICEKLPQELFEKHIDIVANLASPASPPHYQRLAVETLLVGSLGTQNMLDLAKVHKARFFHTSTSEVYGDPEVHPQPENYKGSVNSYGPRSMYDEAKRYAEALIYVYRNKYKLNTSIVRIFNTYGPNMDPLDGRVVSNFIMQALKGDPITIYGDGTQTRSFCYVEDLIEGFIRLIESDQEGPINIGNPGEFTMLELAEKVIKLTSSKSQLVHMPLPGDDPTQRKPDITKAKSLLGWEPKIDLDTGLKLTIEYFKTKF